MTIGRIVHFATQDRNSRSMCLPGLVVNVPPLLSEQPNTGPEGYVEAVDLTVFSNVGLMFPAEVAHDDGQSPGTWHWPCVVTEEKS